MTVREIMTGGNLVILSPKTALTCIEILYMHIQRQLCIPSFHCITVCEVALQTHLVVASYPSCLIVSFRNNWTPRDTHKIYSLVYLHLLWENLIITFSLINQHRGSLTKWKCMKDCCYIHNNSCGLDDRLWHLEFTHFMSLAVLLRNTMLYCSM